MMTPRENLLKTLRCEDPEWIPVYPTDIHPNAHPTREIPPEMADVFDPKNVTWSDYEKNSRLTLKLGDYLGAEEYMLPVNAPAWLKSETCFTKSERIGPTRTATILSTPKGDLRQVTTVPESAPSLVTERYVKTAEDAVKLTAYFDSLRVETSPDMVVAARAIKARAGDRGVLFCRTEGTPLGMCYRVYSDLTNLIYLIADEPTLIGNLFAAMEEKYVRLYERMLQEAPEIDAFFGMDDTSTTLISPRMFEQYNVELTNARADLCHRYGKLYLHHSCGLIRDLLPVYRKTRMDGVDAFTPPPIGNVGYAEGRGLLGPGFSLRAGGLSAVPSFKPEAIRGHVEQRFVDARKAQHVLLGVGGDHLTLPALAAIFTHAQKIKRR